MVTPTFRHAPGLQAYQMLAYNAGEERGLEYFFGRKADPVEYAKAQAQLDHRDFVILRDRAGKVLFDGRSGPSSDAIKAAWDAQWDANGNYVGARPAESYVGVAA